MHDITPDPAASSTLANPFRSHHSLIHESQQKKLTQLEDANESTKEQDLKPQGLFLFKNYVYSIFIL